MFDCCRTIIQKRFARNFPTSRRRSSNIRQTKNNGYSTNSRRLRHFNNYANLKVWAANTQYSTSFFLTNNSLQTEKDSIVFLVLVLLVMLYLLNSNKDRYEICKPHRN